MSNIRNLKLEVVLAAIDKATKPIKAVMGSSSGLSKQLNTTKDKLKELNKAQESITAFRTLTKDAKDTGDKLAAARQKLKEMGAQMAAAGPPTEAMTRKLKSAEIAVEKLTLANRKQIDAARAAKLALDANGISAAKLGTHERELAAKIDVATAAMQRQQDKLAKLSALQNRQRGARSRYEQSLEGRDRLAGAGATTMAAGTAAGLPIVKMIRDYSSFEDAMLGVARQVEGARDANGKLTPTYYQMGDAIKAMAEQIPMATTEIAALVEGGARMGIKGKADLLAFAKTAALASTAFDLPADQISEDLGKIANTYKIPIKNIEQLGDVINWLDDNAQSKGADIINVMQRIAGNTGNMNYKEAAALGSTFLSLGASSEVAANATKAMVRELAIAEKQPKRFQAGLKELGLSAKQVTADMARDSTGTILKVMEAVKKLPEAQQMGVMVDLFGKEYGDDAAKLAGNLGEYRKQLALVNEAKARGSMGREGDAKNDTLSARWQMLQNKLFNQSSGLGSSLRQPLMDIMSTVGQVTDKIAAWTKANPELTATLVKIAAVVAIVLVAVGSLMLAIAGIAGPFIAWRFAMSSISIALTSGIGIMGKLGGALGMIGRAMMWLGRLFLMNPIGLAVTVIAGGAYLIWSNWSTLGPKFSALWDGIKSGASSLWDGIKNAASSAFTAVSSAAASVWANIKQAFSGGILGVSQLIINWSPLGLFYQAFAAVMNYFGVSMPAKFTDFGRNILQGLVNGITSSMGAVKNAITSAGEKTIGWFKEKLGIHSPSRVFAELGGFTMQGLSVGLDKGSAGPLAAIKDFAGNLIDRAKGIVLPAPTVSPQDEDRAITRQRVLAEPPPLLQRIQAALPDINLPALDLGGVANGFGLDALRELAGKITAVSAGLAIGTASAAPVPIDTRPPLAASRPAAQLSAPDSVTFNIYQAPGQSPQELARVIEQMLDARDRKKAAAGRGRLTDKD